MDIVSHLRSQFDYEFWANGEVLRALAAMQPAPSKAVQLMSHIVAGERLWLDRLEQTGQSLTVWPDMSPQELEFQLNKCMCAWKGFLAGLSDEQLSQSCRYVNSKGEAYENTVLEILTHLLFHSAYHRGQIAIELRRAGTQPAYTDYIHAVRQGYLRTG